MALTTEQQAMLDAQQANQLALETFRASTQAASDTRTAKIEAVRMAKDVLMENNRSKPADSRELSSAEITTFATALLTFITA
tara:strand:- start:2975 stop:3220 length:246 start_codon:yes stop_codon:yes gene_type:complete